MSAPRRWCSLVLCGLAVAARPQRLCRVLLGCTGRRPGSGVQTDDYISIANR